EQTALADQDKWVAKQHHDQFADTKPTASTSSAAKPAATRPVTTPDAQDATTDDTVALPQYAGVADPVGAYAARKPTGLSAD
ncbi:MAG: hypothetical protein ACTHON_14970, partial [Humibacter sp.]